MITLQKRRQTTLLCIKSIVHFEMTFPPMPADTHILHFTEGQNNDYAWKLCT